jgi:membrane fusion protein (multidrug efflux system)
VLNRIKNRLSDYWNSLPKEKRKYAAALLAALALLLIWTIYSFLPKGAPLPHGQEGMPVVITVAESIDFKDVIEALGTSQANESVELTANVTEVVTNIHFEEGQLVEKGDVIVELLAEEEKAALVEAQKQFERIENLAQTQAATLTRRDEQLRKLEVAKAQLNDRKIIAPFSGILGLRRVSEGALVTPGTVITTLDDISVIKLVFTVPEKYLSRVSVGQKLETYSVAYPGKIFEGIIYTIDPRVDPATRAFNVKGKIPNPDHLLKPGMLMTVNIVVGEEKTILLPEEAIQIKSGEQVVFLVKEDNTALAVKVKTGKRIKGSIEVLSGVKTGDKIIVEGSPFLQSGAKVNISGVKTLEQSAEEFFEYNESIP